VQFACPLQISPLGCLQKSLREAQSTVDLQQLPVLLAQVVPQAGASGGGGLASAGGLAQAAPGKLPVQPLAQVMVPVVPRQPLPSNPQVASVEPRQTLPAPPQSEGPGGQAQAAFGKPPVQVLPDEQEPLAVVVRQPLASNPQVARVLLARHTEPGPLQSEGPAGQVHWAAGALPEQDLPAGQLLRPTMSRQPLLPLAQVATLLADSQKVPAWPAHPAGAGKQVQAAFELPMQGLPAGQVLRELTPRQPLLATPHWATVVDDSQKRSWVPLQPAGGAGQVQAPLGAAPMQGRPAGQAI
jgi:hypothetical protein